MESRSVASKTPHQQQGSTPDVDVGSYKSELIISLTCDSSATSVNNCDEIKINSAALANADVSVSAHTNGNVIENNSDAVNGNKIGADSYLANDIAINTNLINYSDDKPINISANDDHTVNINNIVGATNDSVTNFVSDTSAKVDDKYILNKQENNNNLLKECIGNESVINSVIFCDNTNDNALSRCVTFGVLTDTGASEKHFNDKDCLIYSGANKNVFDEKCIDNVQPDSSVKSTDTESDDFSDEKVTFRVRVVENSPLSNTKPLKSILKSPKRELSLTEEKSETADLKGDDIIEPISEIKRAKPLVPPRVSSLSYCDLKSIEEKPDKSEDYDTSVKNVQDRLAESKSKIDQLQKSLPTRLSSATVESLKIKYSPASFGYPKTFLKSTEENQLEATRQTLLLSKIPVQSNLNDNTSIKDQGAIETVKVKDFENSERKSSQTDEDIIKNILFGNKKKIEKQDSFEDQSSVGENKPVEVKLVNSFVYPDSEQKSNSELSKESLEKSVDIETSIISQDRKNKKIKTDKTKESNNTAADSVIKPIEIESKSTSIEVIINKNAVEKLPESDANKTNIDGNLKENNQDTSAHETNVIFEENIVPENTDITNSTKEIREQIIIDEEKRDAYADLIKQFTMADKKDGKKRSNSFRRIFPSGLFGSSKDKHKHCIDSKKSKPDKNGIKKSQHNSFSTENAHNEIEYFDRQRADRHTIGHCPYYYDQRSDRNNYITGHGASTESYYSNSTYTPSAFVNKPTINYGYQQGRGNLNLRQIERDGMDSETLNGSFVTSTPISENFPVEDYVCMDNMTAGISKDAKNKYVNINNYFDASTSSSTNTLTSDTPCYTYDSQQGRRDVSRISSSKTHNTENTENVLRRYYAESKLCERNATKSPEQFTQALCASESNQDPELIKPKAIIPINTERPLANPYHNVKDNISRSDAEQLYGNLAYADDEDDYEMDKKTILKRGSENKINLLSENVLQQQTSVDTPEKLKSFQNANKSPYETIYNVSVSKSSVESGIKANNVENSNSTSYGSLIPVSAHVKISKTPIISPKKSVDKLRARSLSPEQRYKLDVPKTNQTILPDSPIKKVSTPLKNKVTNKTSNKREDIKINEVVEEESRKICNLPKNQRKSPKSEKKINKSLKPREQQIKTRINSPMHQNLEIELDYPDHNLNENRIQKESPQKDVYADKKSDVYTSTPNSSRLENYKESDDLIRATNFRSLKEASTFDNVQASKIPMKENYEEIVTTHPKISSNQPENYSRNVKSPLTVQTQPPSTLQIQPPLSPQKQQILQHVEAFYWSQKQKESMQNSPNRACISSRSPSRISMDSPSNTLTQSVMLQNNSPTQYFSNQRLNSPQNVPINRNTNSPIINQRSSLSKIPQSSSNSPTQQTIPVSPQKIQNLQKVEAFYWQKIREMKEKEEEEIMKQHQILFQHQNYPVIRGPQPPVEINSSRRIRSRSVSPGFSRHDKRNLSLPRGVNYYPSQENNQSNLSEGTYGYAPIKEQGYNYQSTHLSRQDRVPSNRANQNTVTQNPNFVRNSLQRNTIGPINSQRNSNPRNIIRDVIYENFIPGVQLRNQQQAVPRSDQTSAGYAPIFKRGSLVSNMPPLNQDSGLQSLKKVSFSGGIDNRNLHVWPTKDGFTKSPPTRVKRLDSGGSDNVFTPSPSGAVNELKFNDFPQPTQNYQNNQLSPETVYGKTTPKQVTVTNKVCDIYGKIHDQDEAKSKMYGQIQKTGVIYGELKKKPNDPYNPNIIQAPNKPLPRSPITVIGSGNKPVTGAVPRIVIGKDGKPVTVVSKSFSEMKISETDSSRLVISAGSVLGLPEAPNRPLPPVPPGMGDNRHVSRSVAFRYGTNKPMMMLKVPPVSESESGSEAGEVQRILQQGVVAGRPNAVKGVMQIGEWI